MGVNSLHDRVGQARTIVPVAPLPVAFAAREAATQDIASSFEGAEKHPHDSHDCVNIKGPVEITKVIAAAIDARGTC